ncbi:SGNH/GDSL hydrolase family protein [Rhodococcoides kyotonense]|uniref:GDSL-like Lipase/Acylhydrolase family protein n=1 Tax=Rhodococcoides kyotonense TaxID=398843 RepID=A0A239KKH6_9NOCA|nr:SGNH/GDSL hydrolase family protein [Rhodococcus kyotonensis]SNT18099.1 GDSL-like Lipase/Acylhydrolase family protein [Rhodococcus kyotonensis]
MRRAAVGLLAAGLALAGCGTSPEEVVADSPPAIDYVALGDSAASGPLIPPSTGTPGCLQSGANYPHVLAGLIGAQTFVDVSCSGARSENITTTPQQTNSGPIPIQLDALSSDTDLVTITIGGNDVDLVSAARGCVNFSPEPNGSSCADALTAGGDDRIADAIAAAAPRWGETLDAIAERAPNADIVVVGYGTYVQPGGCYGVQPVWARDADYLQASVDKLNDALAAQAEQHDAAFVDVRPVSVGHDACAAPDQRYLEGVVPANPAAPLHPTAAGMAAFAQVVEDSL